MASDKMSLGFSAASLRAFSRRAATFWSCDALEATWAWSDNDRTQANERESSGLGRDRKRPQTLETLWWNHEAGEAYSQGMSTFYMPCGPDTYVLIHTC